MQAPFANWNEFWKKTDNVANLVGIRSICSSPMQLLDPFPCINRKICGFFVAFQNQFYVLTSKYKRVVFL